ncbi:unnamed protein product, partial [Meganyctiphanes norvegica]
MSSGALQREAVAPPSGGPGQTSSPGSPVQYFSHHDLHNIKDKELHLAALNSLKKETLELSSRLKMVSHERDMLDNTLTRTQLDRVRLERESADRLDSQAARYEERLIELHSVIAELTRKIDQQRSNVIHEEEDQEDELDNQEENQDDFSHSEISHENQDATANSTSEAVESEEQEALEEQQNTATDASTSCDIDDRAVEAGHGIADLDVSECRRDSATTSSCRGSAEEGCRSVGGLEEELKALREENTSLQHALALAQHTACNHRATVNAITQERDTLLKKVREYHRMQPAMPPQASHVADAVTVRGLRGAPMASLIANNSGSPAGTVSPMAPSPQPPDGHTQTPNTEQTQFIWKLAERVRLKKAESGNSRITASDLSNIGVWSTPVAEQLVAGVQEESDAQELYHALATAGGTLQPHERLKEFEVEIERLHSKVDHLKSQNDVLAITLSESKAHCDHLSIQMGKYESNSTALQLAVTNLDQTIEAFEILVALLESEIGLLLASCRAAGVGVKGGTNVSYGDHEDLVALVRRAQDQRRSTENVARHLLSRLERSGHDSDGWDETNTSHNTSAASSTSSGVDSDMSRGEEHRLRETINRLREERNNVTSSVMPLESVHVDPLTRHYPLSLPEAYKLDLENAVLMQELTAMREDRAELRAQVYLLEREKAGLELRVGTCEAQAAAYCATIDHLRSELAIANPEAKPDGETEGDSGVDSSSPEIMEALRRERQLKQRVQDLVTTLEKVTKNSEARHMQSQEFINDLKKANGALLTAVDRLKKKYALKVKRMEQQMMGMVERHAHQVRVLKQRSAALENELGGRQGEHGSRGVQAQMVSTGRDSSL